MRDFAVVAALLVSVAAVRLAAAPTISEFLVRVRSRRLPPNFAIRLEEEGH